MDTPELSLDQLEAGRAYYEALGKLGLNPEGLLWAYDYEDRAFRLWLIWSGIDQYGPLAISKLLFKAYRAAALPRKISPFSVHIVNNSHVLAISIENISKAPPAERYNYYRITRPGQEKEPILFFRKDWIYHLQPGRFENKKIKRDWTSFNKNIDTIAA
ncbi:hypothetical protein Q8W71_26745 [Methylobacterium sp. NEAU 140]|uniref:hypothetical protein n=1 Tax=Methylobacterium sp. NEAU 140 TaxID=3064945 RepID=UPI002734DFD6|nr:hypothetical protein [Methylobacterium sp. NEAU 140]MDP4026230.1 hypothetical protein [Methylobacterium sp. NEAU 140]